MEVEVERNGMESTQGFSTLKVTEEECHLDGMEWT